MSEKPHDEHKKEGHGGGGHGGHGGGHGGGHEEGHEGAPEWLISFADMVMLMMGFFVILFALNVSPTDRKQTGGSSDDESQGANGSASASANMLDFAIAMREAFNNPVDIKSADPQDQALVQRIIERMGKKEAVTDGIKGSDRDVQSIRPSDYHAVSGSVPFVENSAELSSAGSATLKEVADKVRGMTLMIEIRGHASAAEAFDREEFGMRLSMDRAMAVARGLAALGVDWWQMRVIAASDHDRLERFPKGQADDRLNARVEIVVTDEVVPPQVPTNQQS